MAEPIATSSGPDSSWPGSSWLEYRAVWRWHFYAGLFCIPLVILLSITGAMYLFKPQVEAWIDRDMEQLVSDGPRASAVAQVDAALAATPGAQLLAYELPFSTATSTTSAVRVLVQSNGDALRVYVHPQSLQVLKITREEDRFMRVVRTLHGELLMGNTGSLIVELAASWAIVMLITGIYLWWPRQIKGLAGILWPRLLRGQRIFWRDLHAVTGIWISAFALFLLLTGLPWAKFWGSYFKAARDLTNTSVVQQDWSVGSTRAAQDLSAKVATAKGVSLEHLGHQHHEGMTMPAANYADLDRVISTVAPLQLAPPVLISPPAPGSNYWAAKSDAQNRPLRVNLVIDGASGDILKREDFDQRHIVDRVIGVGVAAHEGQLFGWLNQLLGLLTALGLILLSVSGVILWWRRRAVGVLGAPTPTQPARLSWGLVVVVAALAIYLPLFGVSVALVLVLERFVFSRSAAASAWLGLSGRT